MPQEKRAFSNDRSTSLIVTFLIGCSLLLMVVSPAAAQEGLFVGYELGYRSYNTEMISDIQGHGITGALRIGYAASPSAAFGLRAGFGPSDNSQLAVTVAYRFRHRRSFRPFVEAGWGLYSTVLNSGTVFERVIRGNGPDVGLGFEYFVHPHASLGLAVHERYVHYTRLSYSINGVSTLAMLRWTVYYR